MTDRVDGAAVRLLLAGLDGSTILSPATVHDAFASAQPLLAKGGAPLRRALQPAGGGALPGSLAASVRDLRDDRGSVAATVGADSLVLAEVDGHLLRAMAAGLPDRARTEEVAAARAAVQRVADGIDTNARITITLTARKGTLPLTIHNTTGGPVQARIRLRSPKLELPGGSDLAVTLDGPSTRIDIPVRTRASGSFPFDAVVTSPDGRLVLAATRYSVRSTAVSGLGLVLSAGAGLFLVVWWARHWREARRSAKLVGSAHPVVSGPKHAAKK